MAAPVFKKIAKKIYNDLPKTIHIQLDQVHQLSSTKNNITTTKGIIPDLKGMTLMEALSILEPMGLKVETKGRGKVRKQSPRAGASFQINETITLEL